MSRFAIRVLTFAIALAVVTHAAAQTPKTVKTAINPLISSNLPVLIAIEKGYFAAEGINLQVARYNGSSVTQMPLLTRGDLDVTLMVAGPGIFNQRAEGFDTKLIASISEPHAGWHDTSWLIVRKDVWDAGTVRTLADMKGRVVDSGTAGSANSMLLNQALLAAGLKRADVKYSSRIRAADGLAALTNKAVEVLASLEPTVGELVAQGLAVRLASSTDVMPWFQETYFAASSEWLAKNQAVAVAFLKAYLRGAKDVTANGPKWNPEHVAILASWSKIPGETITKLPSPSYFGQYGAIRMEALVRQQDFWHSDGLVKIPIDAATIVDTRYIEQARKEMNVN